METETLLAGVADKAVDPPSPPEEMMVRNTAGCTEWSEAIKAARIEIIDLGNSVPHPDRFNCPYVNRIGQLTVSVLLNRFARKEHRA